MIIVPAKIFKSLLKKPLKEDDYRYVGRKPFNWKTMEENSEDFIHLDRYMMREISDCKFIGEGSSRKAFILPSGVRNSKNEMCYPSCFKIAKNDAGVAQNNAEIEMFNAREYECYPKLYDYDERSGKNNPMYVLTEVGTDIRDAEYNHLFSVRSYFNEWNDEFIQYCRSNSADPEITSVIPMNDFHHFMFMIKNFGNVAYFKSVMEFIENFVNEVSKKYKKYSVIESMLQFCKTQGDSMVYGDFIQIQNWAIVVRSGYAVPIPIDFGFTKKVWREYY